MTNFLQLHLLTSYPPSNLNRDDLGRPKTVLLGGRTRLRVSSQSLKRAWRTSELFEAALKGKNGTRTREMGEQVFNRLVAAGLAEKKATEAAKAIAKHFAKPDKKNPMKTGQLVHYGPDEVAAIHDLADRIAAGETLADSEELELLRKSHRAADIALFGRMLAEKPDFNTDASCQVAHALTVHAVEVEDDFFSAVDDLNTQEDDAGAGHLGATEFGAGVFYLYLCIDLDRLLENLGGDGPLAERTLRALIECAATVAPTGKQNSFASRAYASYLLAEKGSRQPRTLATAFLRPITLRDGDGDARGDFVRAAIERLEQTRDRFAQAYGPSWAAESKMDVPAGEGTLAAVQDFAASRIEV